MTVIVKASLCSNTHEVLRKWARLSLIAQLLRPGQYSSFTHIIAIANTGSVKNVVGVLLEWTWV